jgi:hypothetical protein
MNNDKFAVIGGGWYGSHITSTLMGLGFDVTLYERSERLLHAASGNNQFRLHMGFHYARHHGTRVQSRDGFTRFMERYRPLTRPVAQNIYAVATDESLIDYPTYKLIMTASGLDFRDIEVPAVLANVDGAMLTTERVLLLDRVRRYFSEILGHCLVLGHEVKSVQTSGDSVYVDGQGYDYVIDCTWGHLHRPTMPIFYEPTLLLYYESEPDFPAITLVDGPLCSIYPTEDASIYTLSSVLHTPLGRFSHAHEARQFLASVGSDLVRVKREAMEQQISRYVPSFNERFRFLGPQLSVKTKLVGSVDDRSCYVMQHERVISVMSGKIDTVFHAMERILSIIEYGHRKESVLVLGTLRSDITGTASADTRDD